MLLAMAILTAVVAGIVGGMAISRRLYRVRIGYRCVKCGDESHGWTLCLECHIDERNEHGPR